MIVWKLKKRFILDFHSSITKTILDFSQSLKLFLRFYFDEGGIIAERRSTVRTTVEPINNNIHHNYYLLDNINVEYFLHVIL